MMQECDVRYPSLSSFQTLASWFQASKHFLDRIWRSLLEPLLGFVIWIGDRRLAVRQSIRIPNAQFDSLCLIFPSLEDGSLEAVVGLRTEHMDRLGEDDLFMRFATAK